MSWRWLATWAIAMVALGWAAAPAVHRVLRELPDHGDALAMPFALVWLAAASWAATQAGVPYHAALVGALGLLAVSGVVGRTPPGARIGLSAPWLPGRQQGGFLLAFAVFAALRALRPDIFGAEKFMDFAFLNALVRTDTLPPEDPWMSGVRANYYYGGYLLFSGPARLLGAPPGIAFNLALATVGGVLFSAASALGRALGAGPRLALLAGVAAAVLGNLDAARQLLLEHSGIAGFDWWRPSRVVSNTITEFPFFSLLHGDLHPHLTALLIVLPVLAIVVAGTAAQDDQLLDRPRAAALALLLAWLIVSNPWDVPACLAVAGLAWVGVLRRRRGAVVSVTSALPRVAALAVASLALAVPFLLAFDSPSGGLGWVRARTTLVPFLTAFGVLLAPALLGLGRAAVCWLPQPGERRHLMLAAGALALLIVWIATASAALLLAVVLAAGAAGLLFAGDRGRDVPLAALTGTAAVLLAACELVFVRDAYGEALHRMNTVFKLYFEAWLLLSIVLPALVARAVAGRGRLAAGMAIGVLLCAAACYPVATTVGRVRARTAPLSLDGMAYLQREHPGDAAAIAWLSATSGRPVVLEATGDPYTYFGRISANTGLPTVLGWANHERVWRGDDPRIAARREAVRAIYAGDDPGHADALLHEYGVRFVVVGALERQTYGAERTARFAVDTSRFTLVFRGRDTAIFVVRAADQPAPRRTMTTVPAPADVTAAVRASSTAMPSGRSSGVAGSAVPSGRPSAS